MSHITIIKEAFYLFFRKFKGEDQSQLLWKEKYWSYLNLYYVTEESNNPDNPNGIIEHKL